MDLSSLGAEAEQMVEEETIRILDEEVEKIYAKAVEQCDKFIQEFYGQYSPIIYDRMHSFDNVVIPWKEEVLGNKLSRRVGFKVLEGVAGGHKDTDEYVFNGVMNLGVHGTSQIATSTPPMELIDSFLESL